MSEPNIARISGYPGAVTDPRYDAAVVGIKEGPSFVETGAGQGFA